MIECKDCALYLCATEARNQIWVPWSLLETYSALHSFYISKKQARIRAVGFKRRWWYNRSTTENEQDLPAHMCVGPIAIVVRNTTEDKLHRFIQCLQDSNIPIELREQMILKFIKFMARDEEARNTEA